MIESHEAPTQVSQTWPGSPGLLPAHRLTLCPDFLAGVSVTSELLDLMSLRYSDSTGRVSFPSLVCFLIRLEAMAKAFQNLSQDGKGLYLTKMEWMNLVMYN